MKFVEKQYFNEKTILFFPDHYEAIAVTVDDTGILPNEDGKKIVPRGTIVGGVSGSILTDPAQLVADKNTPDVRAEKEIGQIKFTAVSGGSSGNGITIAFTDPSGNDKPLTVSVTTNAISIALATDSSGAITSTYAEIVDAIVANVLASALVTATLTNEAAGTTVAVAASTTNLERGATGSASGAEGMLLNDTDVTYGPAACAMLLHGFVDLKKLPEEPCQEAIEKLPLITFIR